MNTPNSNDDIFNVSIGFQKTPAQLKLLRRCLDGDPSAFEAVGALVVPIILAQIREQNWIYRE